MNSSISIIIPTYNESENIRVLISEIKKTIHFDYEIIVVDDNSPDKTYEIVEQLSKSDNRIKLILRTEEKGLTSAIKTGIQNANYDIVLWLDADLSMPTSKIPELLNTLNEHDICIGSRYIKNGKDNRGLWLHGKLSFIINKLCKLFLSNKINDWTSGFVCAKKSVFKKITLRGFYGEYCIDFIYKAIKLKFSIIEIPYICINRKSGNSKTATNIFGFIKTGRRYLSTIMKLKFYDI